MNVLLDLEPCAYGSIENRYELSPMVSTSNGEHAGPKHILADCFRYTAS